MTTQQVTKLMDERTDLAKDLYRLALRDHCPNDEPCDDDLECPDCTLLIGAAEELGMGDPWGSSGERTLTDEGCMNPNCDHDEGLCCGPNGEHHRPLTH